MSVNVMTIEEINEVSGGTEWQCVSTVATIGGGIGAGLGFFGGFGFGALPGFEGGVLVGGLVGGMGCGFFY
jgi:hypothetical protein